MFKYCITFLPFNDKVVSSIPEFMKPFAVNNLTTVLKTYFHISIKIIEKKFLLHRHFNNLQDLLYYPMFVSHVYCSKILETKFSDAVRTS